MLTRFYWSVKMPRLSNSLFYVLGGKTPCVIACLSVLQWHLFSFLEGQDPFIGMKWNVIHFGGPVQNLSHKNVLPLFGVVMFPNLFSTVPVCHHTGYLINFSSINWLKSHWQRHLFCLESIFLSSGSNQNQDRLVEKTSGPRHKRSYFNSLWPEFSLKLFSSFWEI